MYYCFRFLKVSLFCLLALIITSCKEKESVKPIEYDSMANHTLLMYLVADHTSISPSLSSSIESNVVSALKAARDSVEAGSLNLVIFKDNDLSGSSLPELYWVRRNSQLKLDTIPLKTYTSEVNAASPEVFQEVLSTVFDKFSNSKIKGLVFGSHALGWSPSPNFTATTQQSVPSRASQYIGIDSSTGTYGETGYMEMWDFAKAIHQSGVHLNYLILDACNMANVETAYELRQDVDYLVAAVTEILGDGFPYRSVVSELARCQSQSDLPRHLTNSAKLYFRSYSNGVGATVGVYDLSKMIDFGEMYFSLLATCDKIWDLQNLMSASTSTITYWQKDFQQFGRSSVGSLYMFYDLGQWIDYLDPENKEKVKEHLSDIVITNLTTERFISQIDLKYNSGLTISLPHCFKLINKNTDKYLPAYRMTKWGERTMEYLE